MRDKAAETLRRILGLALTLDDGTARSRRETAHEAGLAVARKLGSGGRVVVGRTIDSLLAGGTDIDSAVDVIVSAWLRRTADAA